ncbi:MAG: hypothetical protein BWX71_02524 [Deltaproteobacteria bacterium ADurb.Bin072]|nr:MAG: hypothetical protein BWX71_02524 [Deltaproteobacteria bacterium ADurb.Bin072]
MKRLFRIVIPLLTIMAVAVIAWSAGALRINLEAVKNPQLLLKILERMDYQQDDILAYLSTDDYVLSDPGLTVGSSSAAKLKISNTWYMINGVMYYVASAETAPVDTIPQNKYGAWALEVGTDGTIDEIGATDNATGYASAALAVAGLPAVQADHARLGYATVIKSDGEFTGGTTEWTAAGVTAVYVDLLPTAKLSSDLISRGK